MPFVVSAGGPQVPERLKAAAQIGGRLVMPVGEESKHQELLKITRKGRRRLRRGRSWARSCSCR